MVLRDASFKIVLQKNIFLFMKSSFQTFSEYFKINQPIYTPANYASQNSKIFSNYSKTSPKDARRCLASFGAICKVGSFIFEFCEP